MMVNVMAHSQQYRDFQTHRQKLVELGNQLSHEFVKATAIDSYDFLQEMNLPVLAVGNDGEILWSNNAADGELNNNKSLIGSNYERLLSSKVFDKAAKSPDSVVKSKIPTNAGLRQYQVFVSKAGQGTTPKYYRCVLVPCSCKV